MFTGIIEAVGNIHKIEKKEGDKRFVLDTGKLSLDDVQLGDSIACNGVCLTVVELQSQGFSADVSNETLQCSTLDHYVEGQKINFEKALLPTQRLGGHWVSGHVDAIGCVTHISKNARSTQLSIQAPKTIMHYIAKKGSISMDGISLTVNDVKKESFELNIVPHTLQETWIDNYKTGTQVNLEVDIIARYLERLLHKESLLSEDNPITKAMLQQHGFINK